MAELAAGFMVTPSVRLARPLGAGGMGSVWVADHLALRTQVVVKFMSDELSDDKASIARFSREAAAAASVKSPHVVQIFDHGVGELGPFIVMELLEGEDLAHRLARQPRLPPTLVAFIVAQTCKALSRAHGVGIVHRDIKPENIFLCGKDDSEIFVKLLDFGIAKGINTRMSSATKTNVVMGSPYYMSPESLVSAKNADHRADLWSLGVVAYQALAGKRPFDAETFPGLAIAIHGGEMIPPSQINTDLPASVDAWWFKACARNRHERYNSAKELADSLYLALGSSLPGYESGGGYVDATGGFHMQSSAMPTGAPSTASKLSDSKPGMQSNAQSSPGLPSAASASGTDAPLESGTFPPEEGAARPKKSGLPVALIALGAVVVLGGIGGAVYAFRGSGDGDSKPASSKKSEPEPTSTKKKKPEAEDPTPEPTASAEPTATAEPSASAPPTATASATATATATATSKTTATVATAVGTIKKPIPSASATATTVKTAVPTATVKKPGYDDDIK